jgi:hypothetical protein
MNTASVRFLHFGPAHGDLPTSRTELEALNEKRTMQVDFKYTLNRVKWFLLLALLTSNQFSVRNIFIAHRWH